MTEEQITNGGIGLAGLLTLSFIVAKLGGKIDWPWIWVVSPIWIVAGIIIVALTIIGIVAGIAWMLKILDLTSEEKTELKNIFKTRRK